MVSGLGKGTVSKCARLKSLTLTPSIERLLLLVRCPLTFTSAVPRPAVLTSVGSPATPEERESRKRKFGEARGKVCKVCELMACPIAGVTGLIADGGAVFAP